MMRSLREMRPIPETFVAIVAASLLLTYCKPPPATHESDVVRPDVPQCEGTLIDAVRVGERVQIGLSREGSFMSLDFVGGELEEGGDLVSGGKPGVRVNGGDICAVGILEGDTCLAYLWGKGHCWQVAP